MIGCPTIDDVYLSSIILSDLQCARNFSSLQSCDTCDVNLGGIKLKKEQEQAVIALLEKKDVFAVLPTSSGKSLIYQSYSFAAISAVKCI